MLVTFLLLCCIALFLMAYVWDKWPGMVFIAAMAIMLVMTKPAVSQTLNYHCRGDSGDMVRTQLLCTVRDIL